jgi:hypothetical protein
MTTSAPESDNTNVLASALVTLMISRTGLLLAHALDEVVPKLMW